MKRKAVAILLSAAMISTMTSGTVIFADETADAGVNAAEDLVAKFSAPDASYNPGARWWWPGGAVEEEELKKEIDYMASIGISYVEINPFQVSAILAGDEEKVASVYTSEFYALLDTAVSYCEEKGIVIDLNMGSGWNANSADVTYEDSMGNMALGRMTVTGADIKAALEIPAAERSLFYAEEGSKGEWKEKAIKLQGVLIAKIVGTGTDFVQGEGMFGPKPSYEEVYDAEGNVLKSYDTQIILEREASIYLSAEDAQLADGNIILSEETAEGLEEDAEYEVIAMYYVPSGGKAIDCAMPGWYTVDHMDGNKATEYLSTWLNEENLKAILEKHSNIRALFNDSYEFYSDIYYTESITDLAKDVEKNGLGYDFSKYLPTIYKQYNAAPYYMGLGSTDTYLTFAENDDEKARIQYDYNTLVDKKFQEGLVAFQAESNAHGLAYRQEAYNPPIDTIGAAAYIDIPETEQAEETELIRIASGAHLYGKNLVTCEQYTLGRTPLKNTLEQFKIGFDIMATSGVNNFQYHGMMYSYGVGTEEYGELGWAPFPTIGMRLAENNTLSSYYEELNEYAARVNYLMQQGTINKDVAYYMPFNGALSLTDAVNTMNSQGIAWDAINDASILADDTEVVDGQISVNGGIMTFDALIVEAASVPVSTMEKLKTLAENGANVIFYGAAPMMQPSYMDGAYAEGDAKVGEYAEAILATESGVLAADMENLTAVLAEVITPEVSYETNENVRFIRRTLEDGSELVYLRNIGMEENTITLKVAEEFGNCYWLDQSTGKIYAADKAEDGTITVTMKASKEQLTGMAGFGPNSMAIALLCTTSDEALETEEGLPLVLDQKEASATVNVSIDSLTVGDATYTENVLGKWNTDEFQGGVLKNSDETGVYEGTFALEEIEDGQKVYLTMDELYTAAEITVNGNAAGKVLYSPYKLDITELVQSGENTVMIAVTPRKYNEAYPETPVEELVDTGLAGAVTIEIK